MPWFVQYRSPTLACCSAIVNDPVDHSAERRKITYLVKQELSPEEAAARDLKVLIRKYGVKDDDAFVS